MPCQNHCLCSPAIVFSIQNFIKIESSAYKFFRECQYQVIIYTTELILVLKNEDGVYKTTVSFMYINMS